MSDVEEPGTIIEVRAGTEARWALRNPVLARDETGWTTDTRRVKIGDGVTAWNDLPYAVDDGGKALLVGVPWTAYGDSLVEDTLAPPLGIYPRRAAAELGSGTVTEYAVAGTRINHAANSMLAAGTLPGESAPAAGAVWPGVSARPGPVVIDTMTNDVAHYLGGAVPAAITGAGGDRYLAAMGNLYETALALVSSAARIEETVSPTVGYTGSWVGSGADYVSAGGYAYTTTPGASVTFTLSAAQIAQLGPLAGWVWLVTRQSDPGVAGNAPVDVSIDGGPATTWDPTEWETYGTCNGTPAVIPVQPPADAADHTVTFTHAGVLGEFFLVDCLILASENPGPVLFMAPPIPVVGAWNAAQVAAWKANLIKLEPLARTAVARFPNAVYVPTSVTPEGLIADGVHLNDRGCEQRMNDVVETMRLWFSAWMRNHTVGDTALPVVPVWGVNP